VTSAATYPPTHFCFYIYGPHPPPPRVFHRYKSDGTIDCSTATCGLECALLPTCGWSTGKMDCRSGAKTTMSEIWLGVCGGFLNNNQPTNDASTAAATDAECRLATCGSDCADLVGCGWSSGKDECIAGGHTTTKELGLGVCGQAPATAGPITKLPSDAFCSQTSCARVCSGLTGCGWSRGKNDCRPGARTTSSEMSLGTC
jgi:hypothetical protein